MRLKAIILCLNKNKCSLRAIPCIGKCSIFFYFHLSYKTLILIYIIRANQMLRRIDAFNKTGMVLKKVMTKIEPVEPYEHNGDKFFQHLHATGEKNWVPKSVRPCKKKSKNAQNVVRTLYKRSPTLETDSSNDTTTENDTHSPQTNTAVTENSKQSDKYSAPNEKEIKEFLQEQIKIDAQEKDQERKLECRAEAVEESPPEDEVYEDSEHPDKHPSPIQVIDPSSFERLQKSCDIDEVIDIIQHQKREDLTIIKYIDQAEVTRQTKLKWEKVAE